MNPIDKISGTAVLLDRDDIDTDQIYPGRYYVLLERFDRALFANWRFLPDGSPDTGFVLNSPNAHGARILVAGRNFGCGSSRENAVWALQDFGFQAVVAPSFAEIFYGNAIQKGLLPAIVDESDFRRLADLLTPARAGVLTLDLERQSIGLPDGETLGFDIASEPRRHLLLGLDPIAQTLERSQDIRSFTAADSKRRPWAIPTVRF